MTNSEPHATGVLTIDLDAIASNWRQLENKVGPTAHCAGVVKADAYGLGAARVAPALAAAGCQRFFVATPDEGGALRTILPEAEIFVLSGPFAGNGTVFLEHRLMPVLNSLDQAAHWRDLAREHNLPLPSAIHVDTGMSRLGLSVGEAEALAEDGTWRTAIAPRLIMSHLACADEPDHELNRRQLALFSARRRLFPGIPGSLSASSGIFLGADWWADWCRPGAALYGLRPTAGLPNPMAPVARLEARILQVHDIDAGETVGYGATHRADRKGRLATVAAGYADGLFRSLGNRGFGYLGEHRVPLVGRVSMDLVVFDITGLPDGVARPGGMLTLIGGPNGADDVAAAAGTIGYEVLTALGRRYHRRYLGGSGS
jgi:alanine racemase